MAVKKPQIDYKAAIPNIVKGYAHWILALLAGYFIAQDFVLSNGGTWPAMSFIDMLANLGEKFGLWGAGGAGAIAAFEFYRQKGK